MSRDEKRAETRRKVYEAALAVFRRDGVDCAVDEIARRAGVSRGTFYFHFPTKDDVLLARMRETEDGIVAAIAAVPEDAPLSQMLDAISTEMARAWEPDPTLLPDVACAALRLAAMAPFDQRSITLRHLMSVRFQAAQLRGELLAILPAEVLSDIYLANTLGGLLGWFGHQETPLKVVLDGVAVLFTRGAGPPPSLS
jgi:AcrR family transcriptional regulator